MGTKITLPFLLIFFTSLGTAQTRKLIQGKILVTNASPADVLILNKDTNQETKCSLDGSFVIVAKVNDIIDFASPNFDYSRKIIDSSAYNEGKITVVLTSKQIVLDEVEIKSYNAVGLGLLQKPAKSYTPAERRLKTAGDFKPIHLLSIIGGGMPLDPVFNAINGKTKRLKKEIKLERSSKRLAQFQTFFPEADLIKRVKIDPDEIAEFTYFVLDEKEFQTILENRDQNKMLFYLIQKHTEFKNQKQSNEN